MKDFIKIFVFLLAVVVAFVFGRNYGEKTVTESDEFKTNRDAQERLLKSEEELKLAKEKLQNLLDSADLKKADELFTKIMTMFLVDLGLRISEEKQKDLDIGKANLAKCVQAPEATKQEPVKKTSEEAAPKIKEKKWSKTDSRKFKSKEWLLQNSTSESAIRNNLQFLNITNLDEYLKGAPPAGALDAAALLGVYRGKIADITNREYGSLVIEIKTIDDQISGSVKVFRDGNSETSSSFKAATFGFKPTDFSGLVFNVGDRYFQIYKVNNLEKLTGYFYERLPNGTSKTIGSFILSRTDRF